MVTLIRIQHFYWLSPILNPMKDPRQRILKGLLPFKWDIGVIYGYVGLGKRKDTKGIGDRKAQV